MRKTALIAISLIVLLILALLFWRVRLAGKKESELAPTPTPKQVELLPEEILVASFKPLTGKNYLFTIEKIPEGVVSLAYEIAYDTANKGTQGIISSPIEIKPGQTSYQNKEFVFGTCSKNKCVYDTGITNLEVTVRLSYQDGKEKIWKKALPAPRQ